MTIDGVFTPTARPLDMREVARAIADHGERIRDDVRVPVLVFQSETDVILLGGGKADQRDGDHVRVWELAGAAHADTYIVERRAPRRRGDTWCPAGRAHAPDLRPDHRQDGVADQRGPQQHYVGQAALAQLVRWVTDGDMPPAAPRLQVDAAGTGFGAERARQCGRRDPHPVGRGADGRVLGPRPDGGDVRHTLFGRTEPFDEATLAALYPGERRSTCRSSRPPSTPPSLQASSSGADRAEILELAAASYPLVVAGG